MHLVELGQTGACNSSMKVRAGLPIPLKEFEDALQRQAVPVLLVIFLGTNDSRDVSGQCVPKTVANLRSLILKAQQVYGSELPILLIGPPNINKNALGPTRPIADQRETNLRDLGAACEKLAKKWDAASLSSSVLFRTLHC